MELSDTIIAASIGACATMITAGVQLVNAMRASRSDSRPKNGRAARSIVSIIALMAVAGVGGYMFAEVRHQETTQDLREMRDEMNAKLLALATATERLAAHRASEGLRITPSAAVDVITTSTSVLAPVEPSDTKSSVDSEIYAAACGTECNEATAMRDSICGVIPKTAEVTHLDFFLSKVGTLGAGFQKVAADQDVGGAKFLGSRAEHPLDDRSKSVCVDLLHWSQDPYLARIELHYELRMPPAELTSATPPAVLSGPASSDPSVLSY